MSKCRALEILDGQMDGPPVLSSPLVNSTVYQMEHSGAFYPRAHQEAEKMARLAESIYTLFGFQGMRVPFDLCVEAEALGCKIKMGGEPPFPYLAKSLRSALEPFPLSADLFQQGRYPVVFQSLKYLQEKYKNRIPLYAGCTAPFTLGGYLWEAERFSWASDTSGLSPKELPGRTYPQNNSQKTTVDTKGGFYDAKRDNAYSL